LVSGCLQVLPLLEAEAEKRRELTQGRPSKEKLAVKIPPVWEKKQESKSSYQAGKLFNVGEKYVREAKRLKERNPEMLERVKSGATNFSEIRREERIEKVKLQIIEIKKGNIEKPSGLYDVIVIDPPWENPWKSTSDYHPDHYMDRSANPYPEMSIEKIGEIRLPIKDDSILWLWTTHSHIWDALGIMKKWGFEYRCILVWDKKTMGIGAWLRKQCEFCLLGTKGKPVWTTVDTRDIISEQKTSHSTKPEAFYEMVDKICVGRKLDYFARKKREGWESIGDEVK
jgi:N6-adenosine-specific RNA methylase IME4